MNGCECEQCAALAERLLYAEHVRDRLRDALDQAARSLDTLARAGLGADDCLADTSDARNYAVSRARAARYVLADAEVTRVPRG
jgi:hypothetical protein